MFSLRQPTNYLAKRAFSAATHEISAFDLKWKALSDVEKDSVTKEYEELQKGDWRKLSLEQKKNLYTIAYGPKEIKSNEESKKVFFGTVALLGVSALIFGLIRHFANPPPKTLSKEHQEACLEVMKAKNMNPIFGISSKKE